MKKERRGTPLDPRKKEEVLDFFIHNPDAQLKEALLLGVSISTAQKIKQAHPLFFGRLKAWGNPDFFKRRPKTTVALKRKLP